MIFTTFNYFKNIKFSQVLSMILVVSLFFVNVIYSSAQDFPKLRDRFRVDDDQLIDSGIGNLDDLKDYSSVLPEYENLFDDDFNPDSVVLNPSQAYRDDDLDIKIVDNYEGFSGDVLLWDDRAVQYSWDVVISEEGLYEIHVEYIPIPSDVTPIQRRLFIDDEVPFRQADNLSLTRKWEEAGEPYFDLNGDEKSPRLKQIYEWNSSPFLDSKGMYPNPLRFYLTKGSHTISLEYISSAVAIGSITLRPAKNIAKYGEILEWYEDNNFKGYEGESVYKLAQESEFRSHQILRRAYNPDPATDPSPSGNILQNVIGGPRWFSGNQEITWIMNVPEDGLYRLAFRILQNFSVGVTVHRQIKIDGVVPFDEMNAYPFLYDNRWRTQEIVDESGEAYLFYLEKGQREISMTVKTGGLTGLINELESCNLLLSQIIRDITTVTSSQPDPNFQYELDKTIPWIMDDFSELSQRLNIQADYLIETSSRRPPIANSLVGHALEIDSLIDRPSQIPVKLNDLVNMQTSLANWYLNMQSQPLTVDYIELVAYDKQVENFSSNFFQRLRVTLLNFYQSFFKDYDNIGTERTELNGDIEQIEKIDVWIARPKEWGELMQILTDEEFTRDTGIVVDINILPAGSAAAVGTVSPLMLSIISGRAPDIAIGSDPLTPVELAIRDSAQDLRGFEGFDEVYSRFLPGAFEPLEFEGGVYALPETMNFYLMFYRKDIVSDLGIPLPNTWNDLYTKTVPMLKQNGLEMFMLLDFNMFLFQQGGVFYKENNTKTALDSDAAYRAFLQWTDNYTVYKISASANLFNHFRVGDIPIAIGSMAEYIMFLHAAPELFGRWGIAPVPGIMDLEGNIDRSAGGPISTSLMFRQSQNKEASWRFLKWWMESETQLRYGSEIEAIVGPEARWLSANIDAFEAMSWDAQHLDVMRQAWNWYRNPPNVLGGYYSSRHLNNAWTRTVLGGMNPRDSLELAVKAINRELERKNDEYRRIYDR